MEGARTNLPLLNQIVPQAKSINIIPLNNIYAALIYSNGDNSFIGAIHTMFGSMTSMTMKEPFENPKMCLSGDKIIGYSTTCLAQIRFEVEYGLLVDAIGKTKPNFATIRALWGNSAEVMNFSTSSTMRVLLIS